MNGVTGRQTCCWSVVVTMKPKILHSLMQQRGFYPMAAAQRLGEEYTLKIDKAPANANPALTQGPEMACAS